MSAIRAETLKFFDETQYIEGSAETRHSPSSTYLFKSSKFKQNDPTRDWSVIKVEILDAKTNQPCVEFFMNDDHMFHKWLEKDGSELLICAEVLCGGQTIINPKSKTIYSFAPEEDGFIWVDWALSPDEKFLATFGCYWACPYEIKVYAFSDYTSLPLKEVYSDALLKEESGKIEWVSNRSFKSIANDGSERTHDLNAV